MGDHWHRGRFADLATAGDSVVQIPFLSLPLLRPPESRPLPPSPPVANPPPSPNHHGVHGGPPLHTMPGVLASARNRREGESPPPCGSAAASPPRLRPFREGPVRNGSDRTRSKRARGGSTARRGKGQEFRTVALFQWGRRVFLILLPFTELRHAAFSPFAAPCLQESPAFPPLSPGPNPPPSPDPSRPPRRARLSQHARESTIGGAEGEERSGTSPLPPDGGLPGDPVTPGALASARNRTGGTRPSPTAFRGASGAAVAPVSIGSGPERPGPDPLETGAWRVNGQERPRPGVPYGCPLSIGEEGVLDPPALHGTPACRLFAVCRSLPPGIARFPPPFPGSEPAPLSRPVPAPTAGPPLPTRPGVHHRGGGG